MATANSISELYKTLNRGQQRGPKRSVRRRLWVVRRIKIRDLCSEVVPQKVQTGFMQKIDAKPAPGSSCSMHRTRQMRDHVPEDDMGQGLRFSAMTCQSMVDAGGDCMRVIGGLRTANIKVSRCHIDMLTKSEHVQISLPEAPHIRPRMLNKMYYF